MTSEYDELLARLDALVNPATPQDSISTATAVETIDGAAAAIRALTAQVVERDTLIEQVRKVRAEARFTEMNSHDAGYVYSSSGVDELLDDLGSILDQAPRDALAPRDAVRDKTVRATALRDAAKGIPYAYDALGLAAEWFRDRADQEEL